LLESRGKGCATNKEQQNMNFLQISGSQPGVREKSQGVRQIFFTY
jgi:hypothetical protein